jgi:hypothetical protein
LPDPVGAISRVERRGGGLLQQGDLMLARLPAPAFEPGAEGWRQQGRWLDGQHGVIPATAAANQCFRGFARGPPLLVS